MNLLSVGRLLALTFFSDPEISQSLQNGTRTDLPTFALTGFSDAITSAFTSVLWQLAKLNLQSPWWLPVTPEITLPAGILSWVGQKGTYPVTPAKDPFYSPALSTYSNLKNGDIIAYREVGLSLLFAKASKAYQVSYRTESTFGEARADVATIIIPVNNDGVNVLSFQFWEDSANIKCSPSYQMMQGLYDPSVDLMLSQGWVLNIPDHQGINSAFAAGVKSGKSTLDSIKAFYKIRTKLGITNTKLGMYGYSGGSIATGHALELLPTYAPDIVVTGAAVGGFVTNITSTLNTISGGLFAGFGASGVLGISTEYPELGTLIQDNLKILSKWRVNAVKQHCLAWSLINYLGQDVFSYLKDKNKVVTSKVYKDMEANELLGKVTTNKFPLYVHEGIQDEIVPVKDVDRVVDAYCKGGQPVIYQRDTVLGHLGEEVLGLMNAIIFLRKTFAGQTYEKCSSWQDATKSATPAPSLTKAQFNNLVLGDYSMFGEGSFVPSSFKPFLKST